MSRIKLQEKYNPERCSCCGQTETYLLPIDKGTVDILRAISRAVMFKGINAIHPRKEMEVNESANVLLFCYDTMILEGNLTSNMVGNLSRPRFHGLIARIKGEAGNYCLTTKGARFLNGTPIPRYAIISKVTGHQEGYWQPEKYQVSIKDFYTDDICWEAINFEIKEGQIIRKIVKEEGQRQMFKH